MAREAWDGVCSCSQDVCIFGGKVGGGVEEDVEAGGDVQVGALKGASQGEDEGDVIVLGGGTVGDGRGGGEGVGGDSAGQWSVVVDVEFQEMEKGVAYRRNSAVDV